MMRLVLLIIGFMFFGKLIGQNDDVYTLDDIIVLAQSESPEVKLAEMRKSNAYWINKSFQADFKPQIDLSVTLPSLNRSFSLVPSVSGTSVFVAQSQMVNRATLSLSQNVAATGGVVFASTGLQRLDLFKTDVIDASTSYVSNPFFFGFSQPITGFNQLKWNKRIMPMIYQESKAKFSEDLESVALRAVSRFFTLLNAQMNLKAAEARKEVADELFLLGENRFSVGNIAETDLLQLEMDVMSADTDISRAKLQKQTANENLRNFLGISENVNFELFLPLEIPEFEIDMDRALSNARSNRSRILELQRQLLEAEQEVASTKASTGINGELSGEVGITGLGSSFGDAYRGLQDQQIITLRLSIPLADWGKSKARYEIAKSNYELINLNTSLERINFENEVRIAVQQFVLVKENVELARRSYDASQKRYDLTRKRYVIGKVDITDLNLADREQENQRQNYVQAINQFWQSYYDIRSLTLYDFINNRSLVREE